MYVGYLCIIIIGDVVVKLLEFFGYKVICQNYMGDWGMQFGMLLVYLSDKFSYNEVVEMVLFDLEDFYCEVKVCFDEEDGFVDCVCEYVVKFQGGDVQCLVLWKQFIDVLILYSEEVYDKLNVSLI